MGSEAPHPKIRIDMSIKRADIDLNAPAFGAGAQTEGDLAKNTSVEDTVVTVGETKDEEEEVASVEENKVPYSRFKNVNEARRQAEAEAETWKQRVTDLEQSRTHTRRDDNETDMPTYWVELYGDSEASKKAWNVQQRRENEIEQRAYEAGQRGAQELETQQRERITANVETLDEGFEELTDYVGRPITDKEQSAVLDIVDEYTAKDADGNYQGAILPFEKAWDIYELKQASKTVTKRSDRDSVAALTATQTNGDTEAAAEQAKNWSPFEKGSWRKRL